MTNPTYTIKQFGRWVATTSDPSTYFAAAGVSYNPAAMAQLGYTMHPFYETYPVGTTFTARIPGFSVTGGFTVTNSEQGMVLSHRNGTTYCLNEILPYTITDVQTPSFI